MKIKPLFLLLLFVLLTAVSFSQSDVNDFTFQATTVQPDSITDPTGTLIGLKCTLQIPLDINLSRISIKAGTIHGGTDVVDQDFTPKTLSKLPSGMLYTVENNSIIIVLGYYPQGQYYYTASISDDQGNESAPKMQ
ncbi:MAG: hypothetical protein KJ607_02865 [Bacteroidetes bacterium]|nr:hypothetical protein [Bacteroidota bacterium]